MVNEERIEDMNSESRNLSGDVQKTVMSIEDMQKKIEQIENTINTMKNEKDNIIFLMMCRDIVEQNIDLIYMKLQSMKKIKEAMGDFE